MGSKLVKWFKLICMAVLAGIGAVQLIYAVAWAIQNGNNIQEFYDTGMYLANAETLSCDGWRLMGYSYILRFFMLFKGLMGDSYVVLVYLAQVIISVACFAEGFRSIACTMFAKKISFWQALFPATYIVTIPIMWQMQFAILPDALCLSLLVLLFAKITNVFGEYKKFCWDCYLVIAGCLLLLGIMHRHSFYGALAIIVIDILVLLIRLFIKRYRVLKSFLGACIIIVMVILIPVAVREANESVTGEGLYATYSVEADLWSRFVYPNLAQDHSAYSERITEIVNDYAVSVCAGTYEFYMNSIGPMIEINNPEEASEIYWEMVETGWLLHKDDMTQSMTKEFISYVFMPFSMVKYIYYSGVSLYGHNYTKMHEMSPKLTADYMHISMIGFAVISFIGCIHFLLMFILEKNGKGRKIAAGLQLLFSLLCIILPPMIFSVARFDYRIGLFSAFIWAGFALANICEQRSKGDKGE